MDFFPLTALEIYHCTWILFEGKSQLICLPPHEFQESMLMGALRELTKVSSWQVLQSAFCCFGFVIFGYRIVLNHQYQNLGSLSLSYTD